MISPPPVLRPMNIGDLLDRAISIYRQNFLAMLGIVAIVNLPLALIEIIVVALALPSDFLSLGRSTLTSNADVNASLLATVVTGATSLVRLFALAFETAALATLISEFFLGQRLSFLQAYQVSFKRGFAILGASLIQGIFVGGLALFAFLPFVAFLLVGPSLGTSSSTSALGALVVLISCLALIPVFALSFFLSIRWLFAEQAIALENFGVFGGLGRSWRLVKGSFWRVFGINFLLGLLIGVIEATPSYAIGMTAVFFPSVALVTVFNNVVQSLIVTILTPIQIAVLTLLYYDLRIRKEGFDLELMAEQLEAQLQTESPA